MKEQGVRIGFFRNAIEGDSIQYYGTINGIKIIFANGLDSVDFEFTNNDAEISSNPLHRVKIGSNEEDTARNVKSFLDNNGYNSVSLSTYTRVYQSEIWNLEHYFLANEDISFEISSPEGIGIVSFNFSPEISIALKYFFQYMNIVGEEYLCQIYQKGFTGSPVEISGNATILKTESQEHLDTIRGSGLKISIESNDSIQFNDFYSMSENDFSVRFFRDRVVIFQGFLKPDGIFQSYVNDIWKIDLVCVDGLGFLADLAFVDNNNSIVNGKISAFDIIKNCLDRTGLRLNINTFVNVYYYGLAFVDLETDVLTKSNFDANRYIKSDNSTTMNCQEVLKSILTVFGAVLTQEYGEWFIYRPSDFYENYYPYFKRYEIDGSYKSLNQLNLNRSIGSQIDGFYPHHCNSNQQIEIKGAVSAFRIGYKYGFAGSILGNGSLFHEAGTTNYEGWDVLTWSENPGTGYLITDPVSVNGISFTSIVNDGVNPVIENLVLVSGESTELLDGYSVEFKAKVISYGFPVRVKFAVNLTPSDGTGSFGMLADGSWSSVYDSMGYLVNSDSMPNTTGELTNITYDRTFSIKSAPLPKSGTLSIRMWVPGKGRTFFGSEFDVYTPPPVLVEVKSLELINTFQGNNVVGEFHTVSRSIPVSSIVKDNKNVSNGDNETKVFLGAIYQENKEDLTSNWYREKFPGIEVKPILRIAAEDELRLSQLPCKLFSGDLYGYCSFLSVYTINKIQGKFMPISWEFDTYRNISKLKLLEFYASEISGINYAKTDDYGETIKPTIV